MRRKGHSRALPILVGIAVVTAIAAATASVAVAPAKSHPQPGPPPDAVLTWNANAVGAVRASTPSKFQTDGMVYMAYVQAAVYDAVTKLEGRYQPYHDFAFTPAPGASVQAAVAAAARTVLNAYVPDQQPTVDAEYNAYLATLGSGVADGVAVGEAAANDLIAFRAGDGLKASPTPSYGGNGPILPGQWQLQPNQAVQTPWLATMRPFLLDGASQFRAGPPPALTSNQYARDLNETEAYGAVNSTVRTDAQKAIAYFWNGNNVNQFNVTMQNVVNQHDMDLVDAAHLLAMGMVVTADAGMACYDSKFFYQFWRPITAIRNADKDGNPSTTADPTWAPLLATPGHPEYPSQHGCFTAAFTDALAAALGTKHLDVTMPGGENGSPNSRPRSTSRRSGTSKSRRSTRASGSVFTTATPSSRARRSATASRTGSWTATSSLPTPSGGAQAGGPSLRGPLAFA